MKYFLDTYALVEITKRNPAFEKFASSRECATGDLNVMELYYLALRDFGEKAAEADYANFSKIMLRHDAEDMKSAMKTRLQTSRERRAGLSYADAVGYAMAQRRSLAFVTGDNAFKEMPGVEFVK